MANKNRGNIFKPFDALEGYNDELHKKEIVTYEKPELTSDRLEELENIFSRIDATTTVSIKYYKNKSFKEIEGNVCNIDTVYKKITVKNENKVIIPIEDILDIKII